MDDKVIRHRIQSKSGTWLNVWSDGRVTNDFHESMIQGVRLCSPQQQDYFARAVDPKTCQYAFEDYLLASFAHSVVHPRKY